MAKFTTGNITKHINKMTIAGAIGILAIFIVDFVDMYFLSILGEPELLAAVGFAGLILFMMVAFGIAMMITMGSIISKIIGRGEEAEAKKVAMNIFYFCLIISIFILILGLAFGKDILILLGAKGKTLEYSLSYFYIIFSVAPFMLMGMAGTGLLRGIGDARGSMMPTLIAGGVNIILDPIFIFGFNWGIEGAAYATAISRIALFGVAIYSIYKHKFFVICGVKLSNNIKEILSIFIPAVITNISTPIGSSFMIRSLSQYGDDAVAGMAVLSRIIPVLFVYIFAMSGAIGSIIGQNYGANLHDRVAETIKKSIIIAGIYIFIVSIILMISHGVVIDIFNISGDGKKLIQFFSYFLSLFFIFNAIIFVGNATFNVIGKAYISTITNILKSIVFLIPLIYIFGNIYGVRGVLLAETVSMIITGSITLYLLRGYINCKKKNT